MSISLREQFNRVLDVEINVRSYSGRGMNGKECLGIVGDPDDLKQAVGEVISNMVEEIGHSEHPRVVEDRIEKVQLEIEKLMRWREDNMGLKVVFYWPKVPFAPKDTEG